MAFVDIATNMVTPQMKLFKEPVGINYTLPEVAKPLDYFFLLLPQTFEEIAS